MASDISITITADPQQAVANINRVTDATKKLGDTAQQTNRQASEGGDVVNTVVRLSNAAQSSLGTTLTATSNLGGQLKQVGHAASGISSALGNSIPIIGQMGSALASIMTGPMGLISAAIAGIGVAINKLIADAEARMARMRASAEVRAGSAYDKLMQGRADYRQQLDLLAQIRELNQLARQSPLQDDEFRTLQDMAGRLGISGRAVTRTGVNPNRLEEVAKKLAADREYNARADMAEYIESFAASFVNEIKNSNLSGVSRDRLLNLGFDDMQASVLRAARYGSGDSAEEIQAYQDLAKRVRQFEDVRKSFSVDPLLGRTQAQLDAEAFDRVKSGVEGRVQDAADRQKLRDRIEADAAREAAAQKRAADAAESEAQRREDAGSAILRKMQEELTYRQMVADGKQREAELLRQQISLETAYGRPLREDELNNLREMSYAIYDLAHPVKPESEPEPAAGPARSAARQAVAIPLDRLQRLGANVTNPVTSPELVAMQRQTSLQEEIRNDVRALALKPADYTMRF